MAAPRLDNRSLDKVRLQLAALAGLYLAPPRWTGVGDASDPAWRLLNDVFARLLEMLISRLNEVPEVQFMRFLDFVGVERSPGSAAAAPVTFLPPKQATLGGDVPAGTRVATTQSEQSPAMEFETRDAFFATPAKLAAIVDLVPASDAFAQLALPDLPPTLAAINTGPKIQALTADASLSRIEHALYLGGAALFGRKDVVDLTVVLTLADDRPNVFSDAYLSWERYDANAKAWLTLTAQYTYATPQMSVRLAGFAGSAPSMVNGVTDNWLRCRYVGPMLPITQLPTLAAVSAALATPGGSTSTAPSLAFANAAPVDLTRPFFPFGERPRQGDAFYLSSPTAFDPAVGAVTLTFTIANYDDPALQAILANIKVVTTITTDIQWQYLDASGTWTNLTRFTHTITATPGAPPAIARATLRDGTATTTEDGTLFGSGAAMSASFAVDPAPVFGRGTVNGVEGAWIRALVMSRDPYGKDGYLDTSGTPAVFVGPSFVPPNVSAIGLSYSHRTPAVAVSVAAITGNFDTQALALPASPFAPVESQPVGTPPTSIAAEPALYFSFDRPFELGFISLFVQLEDRTTGVHAFREGGAPRLSWEYVAAGGTWRPLDVADATADLTSSGTVGFLSPPDQVAAPLFPSLAPAGAAYWFRARLISGRYDYPPVLRGIYINTVMADNLTTSVSPVLLGSSTGDESQQFTLVKTPALNAEVWVQEPEPPSEPELAALFAEFEDASPLDPAAATVVSDAADLVDAPTSDTAAPDAPTYVRWRRVPTFLESGARSRHYTFDAVAGVLTFGDGSLGLIPPPAPNGITLRRLRTGGGDAANDAGPLAISELKTSLPFIDKVFNVATAAGGSDPWDESATLLFGPQEIKNRGRAVTTEDYVWLIRQEFGQVARVRCLPTTAPIGGGALGFKPGAVTCIIVPKSADPTPQPTSGLLANIRGYLTQLALGGIVPDLYFTGPDYKAIRVSADIHPLDIGEASSVVRRAVSALEEFFHPLTGGEQGTGWEFGRDVFISEVNAVLERTPGVDYATNVALIDYPGLTSAIVNDDSLVASGNHQIRII